MPVKINIYEAKTNFSELIHRVMAGEEIIIAKAGQPVARLVPADRPREARQPGSAKGKLTIGPDFDDPLPESLLSEMEQ